MHNNQISSTGGIIFLRIAETAALSGHLVAGWAQRQARKGAGIVKHMQHARMAGVLNNMTDTQLAQVDVKRAEISQVAAKMVNLDQSA